MAVISEIAAVRAIQQHAQRLTGAADDFDPLLKMIGDATVVLIGEASHGTHEFYDIRAEITKRLIEEHGFNAVAAEADWPDAYRVNRYVRGASNDADAEQALRDFTRFPMWMWRNRVVESFAEWLRERNAPLEAKQRAGFFGLDLYSLHRSMAAVVSYLDRVDPEGARLARSRYACFDHAGGENAQLYGYGVWHGMREDCRDEAITQLVELRQKAWEYLRRDGMLAQDEQFFAERNAVLVANAEQYYREMFDRRTNTWNLRDSHMANTLEALMAHLSQRGKPAKVVVWAHNSHIGDARATETSRRGEHNIGQLARERFGESARLIGFTTDAGTVSCASDWDGPLERKHVRPSLPASQERRMHEAEIERFALVMRGNEPLRMELGDSRIERMIGVIYRPETERMSHYMQCRLADQFDAVIHLDKTRALEPLDTTSEWEAGEAETYPFGV